MQNSIEISTDDLVHLRRAIELALETEALGNFAVGSVITLGGQPIAEAANSMLVPEYNPIWHAEMTALSKVPVELWPRSREMTCYSSLEPCIMCTGTLLMHGFGRVVFGSDDPDVGGTAILSSLPRYYDGGRGVPEWVGPCLPEECDPLRDRLHALFAKLPVGSDHF
jgi:tRNA(Arg) A34 adenosine deaminase TadA